jgi:transcriptional regulator with XRE-family HTH domain
MKMRSELGLLLEKLRGKKTLREVSELTGISHTYIRDLELGKRRATGKPVNPSAYVLRKLADCYNYSFTELMKVAGYEDVLREYDENGKKRHDIYKLLTSDSEIVEWKGHQLDERQIEEIINFIEFLLSKK